MSGEVLEVSIRAMLESAFDEDFYRSEYLHDQGEIDDALGHYCLTGWPEGWDPSPDFSTSYYLRMNPDVADAGMNPLQHYIEFGEKEGRRPKSFIELLTDQHIKDIGVAKTAFESEYYKKQIRPQKLSDRSLVEHYVTIGYKEGLNPASWFDTDFYLKIYPDVAESEQNPFAHFLKFGSTESRACYPNDLPVDQKAARDMLIINQFFDDEHYRKQAPEDAKDFPLLEHFATVGWKMGLDPHPDFSTTFYQINYPDIEDAGLNPFVHFIQHGRFEMRDGKPLPFPISPEELEAAELIKQEVDLDYYLAQLDYEHFAPFSLAKHYCAVGWNNNLDPNAEFSTYYYKFENEDIASANINPFVHYMKHGRKEGRRGLPDSLPELNEAQLKIKAAITDEFSVEFYENQYPEVEHFGYDPVDHYILQGWKLGYDPSADFSTNLYLEKYPDIASGGLNPFWHYVCHGKTEGRVASEANPIISDKRVNLEKDAIDGRFDAAFYRQQYAEHISEEMSEVEHYIREGWQQDFDPTPWFSTSYYRRTNPEIHDARINPFWHFVTNGEHEGRDCVSYVEMRQREFRPFVSVIVPNYNHAIFLQKRFDSILSQTYTNFELIVLDDKSKDDSRDVIRQYFDGKDLSQKVRFVFNDSNSGNVFRQWRKGIELAKGDLVWICESDDFCDPKFLENAVKHFADLSVRMVVGKINFCTDDGSPMDGMDLFRETAEPGIWGRTVIRPAQEWYANAFGVRNIVTNVGGCVFRKTSLKDDIWEEAQTYKIAGDWFLYSYLLAGGQLVYEPKSVAYFRQHASNTSASNFKRLYYYDECMRVLMHNCQYWDIPSKTAERFWDDIARQWKHLGMEAEHGPFAEQYPKDKYVGIKRTNKHIAIGFLGFRVGGGEIFAINLANKLAERFDNVSLIAASMSEISEELVTRLSDKVAVYNGVDSKLSSAGNFVSKLGVSLLHSHMISCEALLLRDGSWPEHVPYVVSLHGSYDFDPDSTQQLIDHVIGKVSQWVYTTDRNVEVFHRYPEHVDTFLKVPNAVPLDDRPAPMTRSDLGISEDAVVYTLVARGIEQKGWRAIIQAFKGLTVRFPETEMALLLIGDGEHARSMVIDAAGIPEIHHLGYQSCINAFYRMSDIAVVPTRYDGESFPLCIIQAMQEGLPVIATDIGEIKNMILSDTGDAGILIPNIRHSQTYFKVLESAMEKMLDSSLRDEMGRNSKALGDLRFNMDDMVDKYIKIYDEVIDEKTN